ncbi:hypothetical protein PGTUg99_025306 [Puccinia graminis f. sp. tritici]|uniref:Uncharacterized protein n=1 Tax=Puccinia graminis f. sp. tritici TaxID=56615 RepID=A0A5B0SJ97_PUCGR|nr:hypothetical protein PGTUg99_025306 [Puccinia graminis f. sp. tritici]
MLRLSGRATFAGFTGSVCRPPGRPDDAATCGQLPLYHIAVDPETEEAQSWKAKERRKNYTVKDGWYTRLIHNDFNQKE